MRSSLLPVLALMALLGSACTPAAEMESRVRPEAITAANGEVGRSSVALSPNGTRAYVAWVQRQDSTWNVWLQAFGRNGSVADDPVRVNATPGNAAVHA
ncbi:MAG: hypothetical protein OXT73_11095 [Bacteroidota bacterium]|nr:hypothetical protein [Bacteroidota bacterium]